MALSPAQVEDFVRENARKLLDAEPEVHMVSAKKALEGKLEGNAMLLAESRFYDLEQHITHVLDETERVRLKLMSPVGVGRRIAGETLHKVKARLGVLSADINALESIDTQLALYQEDLRKAFRFRLSDVDNELLEFENRGIEFFDDTLRITRAFDTCKWTLAIDWWPRRSKLTGMRSYAHSRKPESASNRTGPRTPTDSMEPRKSASELWRPTFRPFGIIPPRHRASASEWLRYFLRM